MRLGVSTLSEHKPYLRTLTTLHRAVLGGDVLVACEKEAEWLHQCASDCIQPSSFISSGQTPSRSPR